jgi:hypothetical protein
MPGSVKTVMRPASGSKWMPFSEGGGAIELEGAAGGSREARLLILAAVKVALLVEMVVN